jgi:hypothetical protein
MGEIIFSTYLFRKTSIATAAVIIVLIILDLLMTRQILPYGTPSASIVEVVLFVLTVVIGYGVGTWAIIGYTGKISKDLRTRSRLINGMYFTVMVIQLLLLGILLFVIYNNGTSCHDYFSLCTNANIRISITSVYAISTVAAIAIMGLISIKLFSWYSSSKRNFMLLFYGLAAAALAISIGGDAFDKILLIQIVQEKSPLGVIPQVSFIYKIFEKYHGEIQYKIVNPLTTTLFVVPAQLLNLYNQIIYWTSLSPYILTWIGTALLLHYYYKRTEKKKIGNVKFWIILTIPLVLYLIGSGLIYSLPSDIPYHFYFRLVFRAGTIGSSVLFGLAFYIITRRLDSIKVKDYLIISAMGIIMIGIANEISALQQTYGAAAHSLVLLASYLFSIGLYCSALSVSQDTSLRKIVRKSTTDLLDRIGTAQMEKDIEKNVMKVVENNKKEMEAHTGISTSITDENIKEYLHQLRNAARSHMIYDVICINFFVYSIPIFV